MYEIMCLDKNGNSIDRLTQYDTNQVIYINWDYGNINPVFQFSNMNSEKILVVKGNVENGRAKANVPNILLTESSPIEVYIYLEQEDGNGLINGETIYKSIIPVDEKDKPEDYKYFENTEYLSWVELERQLKYRINKLEADATIALRNVVSPTIDVRKDGNAVIITFADVNGRKTLKISGDITIEVS